MKIMRRILLGVSVIISLGAMVFSFNSGNYYASALLLLITVLLLPFPWIQCPDNTPRPYAGRIKRVLLIFMIIILAGILWIREFNRSSIYASQSKAESILKLYDSKLNGWTVPFRSYYISTSYGKVHVIRSGNPANPPVLLLPAEQQAAWSWIYNIVNLNKNFCTYAIDNIGDVGRSGLSDLRLFPQEDQEISDYLSEILDGIGLEKAIIMGASLGGQMAISLAKEEPERVDRLILLAPWGFSSPHKVINDRLMIRIFRFDSFVNRHRRSVTGSAGVVVNLIDEWLYNALKYSAPAMVSPRIFLSSELEEIEMPVLMILAGNDGILGEPENVKALADNIPDIEIHILESGHLINIERSGDVNKLVNMFLSDSEGGQN